ncbi:Protein of unknown function (DUF2911) [Chitinophaga dinghuensis]|uniref:DUF2911 family protein n=1 Tax=Chitinophaga dinghuensis TaxID=1539050 RepID=A0A327W336_9BACT|nr:DUF2911 domain-containing protein [Chitinophaga dinghuensis]RAJ83202.1 Protein of unknown function (DUF2911) [Chitinophaga dinghuensis]
MKKTIIACVFLLTTISTYAQFNTVPSGDNKRASVSEGIGITQVTINYSRPGVRNREGHIWGEVVHKGYANLGFGTSKAAPWRAGANENTTVTFSTDVMVNGQPLAAGTYGFFVAYDPNESTLIFSKNASSWGSFYYDPNEDVLRIKVKPVATDKSVEWLKYEFIDETPTSATVALEWEKLMIPFKIDVDLVKTQIASFRKELRGTSGFAWQSWDAAASFCAQHNTNLPEALLWADSATSISTGGSLSFQAWSTKSAILDSLGRHEEAITVMKKALPFGSLNDLYFYARQLAHLKQGKEAFDIFKLNYDKHPDEFLTNAGMARGYSAIGDYKKALGYAQKSRAQAPDLPNKDRLDKMIKTLQEGKDIN